MHRSVRRSGITEYLNGTTVSVRFDAHGLHHLAPLLDFLGDELPELSGNVLDRVAVVTAKARSVPALMYPIDAAVVMKKT